MSTLLVAEHNNESLHPNTLHTLTAAQQLGEEIVVLVAGYGCQKVAEEAAFFSPVKKVLLVDELSYEHFLAESLGKLVQELSVDYQFILFPASTFGKDIAPRVAALLDVAGIYSATFSSLKFGLRIKAMVPFTTSRRLCGGMSVAMPTAMPVVPFNKIFGIRAGKVTGSFIEP